MVIIIVFAVMVAVGIVIGILRDWDGTVELVLSAFGGMLLALSLFALGACRMDAYATIRSIEQVRTSIEVARTKGREIELAALAPKIAEYNAEIEQMKYYHDTIFRIYIPDEVMDIRPLE